MHCIPQQLPLHIKEKQFITAEYVGFHFWRVGYFNKSVEKTYFVRTSENGTVTVHLVF
jgi:hypothetical protein